VQYVIVDFPQCTIPAGEALIPGMSPTCVPIPVVTKRCKKTCCSIHALPLRCCVVLSVHKSQGITVKKDNAFEKIIVNLPTEQASTTPGLELVVLSRPDSIHNLAIGNNSSDLSYDDNKNWNCFCFLICKEKIIPEPHTANGTTNTTKNKGFNCTIVPIVNI
jgi:hypothetical protein